jgi:hypothetical protein
LKILRPKVAIPNLPRTAFSRLIKRRQISFSADEILL